MQVRRISCLAAAFILPALVNAQEAAAEPAGVKIANSINVGGTMTDGNSDTSKLNLSLLSEGEREKFGSYRAGAEVNYGQSEVDGDSRTDVDNGKLFVNGRRILDGLFASFDTVALYDDIAEIDYRITAGPGLGVYLVKNPAVEFSVEAGPSYVWEEVADERDDYLAWRFAERLDIPLSPTARLWQQAEYLPQASDFGNYLVNAEAGIEAAVNAHISLRLVLQDKYDSEPGDGLKSNDLTLIGGIKIAL